MIGRSGERGSGISVIYIYIYIYIYINIYILFGPVKPELGVIPSGQDFHSRAEHLDFPGGELNVIFLQSNISLKKKPKTGKFRIINLFPSRF